MGKVAFIFPGQASQYPGMGKELAEKYAGARAVFEEADNALGISGSKRVARPASRPSPTGTLPPPAAACRSPRSRRTWPNWGWQPWRCRPNPSPDCQPGPRCTCPAGSCARGARGGRDRVGYGVAVARNPGDRGHRGPVGDRQVRGGKAGRVHPQGAVGVGHGQMVVLLPARAGIIVGGGGRHAGRGAAVSTRNVARLELAAAALPAKSVTWANQTHRVGALHARPQVPTGRRSCRSRRCR